MEFKENKTEPANPEQAMLDKINKTYEKLQLNVRQKRLGEKIEGCEALKGKKVLMVDDIVEIIQGFVADLMVVTEGNASFILHKDQSEGGLVREILENNPDIILMDKNLAGKVDGVEVVKNILHHRIDVNCIGFSSESKSAEKFIEAGARGFVEKKSDDPETLRLIATLALKK